jgi:C1A family cysteine protease
LNHMKAILFVALLGVAVCSAHLFSEQEYQFLFSKWVAQHSKKYTHENFFYRYTVFKHNMDKVIAHNKAGKSWTLAMNKFGDMTPEEFKSTMLGYNYVNRSVLRSKNAPKKSVGHPNEQEPVVDWRKHGAVTKVKDQKQCGSCWAFSATGSMEGAWFIKNKHLVSLSEQELVDCSGAEGNQGCNGGLMDNAFQYVITNGGIDDESDYPYTAQDGTCNTAASKLVTISSFSDVTPMSTDALDKAIHIGPVSVAIEADQSVFQMYSGGVIDDDSCGTQLDHGVLAVGYSEGDDQGQPYYIVKNSWGANWGLNGYVYIASTEDGTPGICGILSEPSYPIV